MRPSENKGINWLNWTDELRRRGRKITSREVSLPKNRSVLTRKRKQKRKQKHERKHRSRRHGKSRRHSKSHRHNKSRRHSKSRRHNKSRRHSKSHRHSKSRKHKRRSRELNIPLRGKDGMNTFIY
jgi:hypothetical protein